ncbi:T9SS type A sorting domain-containing protein [candidate division WOR-3 bacterium]|nr:T9SS type A sorting domain-containing protein [candidate division WOR-3 bacterium]
MKHSCSIIVLYTLCAFCPLTLFSQTPDTLWTKTYGWGSVDQSYSVQQTTDNCYIVAGQTFQISYDVWLLKIDSLGDTLWTKTYGGSSDDCGNSIQQTCDGGYIIAGYTSSFGAGNYDVYLIKTDSLGDTLWTRTYGGLEGDYASSVQQTIDKGYIMAGITTSFGADGMDAYVIKTDSLGDTLWTRTYGGTGSDFCYAANLTSDKGYILAGRTNSFGAGSYDLYVVRADSLGNQCWTLTCGGIQDEEARSVQQTSDQGYIVTGHTASFGAGIWDVYLVKIAPDTMGVKEQPNIRWNVASNIMDIQVTPNPFCDLTRIELTMPEFEEEYVLHIYDETGRSVKSTRMMNPSRSVYWNGCDDTGKQLASGVYFVTLRAENHSMTIKILLIR